MRALASHSNRPMGLWDAGYTVVPLRGPISKCCRRGIIQGGDVLGWESKCFKNSKSQVHNSRVKLEQNFGSMFYKNEEQINERKEWQNQN